MVPPVETGLLSVAPGEPANAGLSIAELHTLPAALAQPSPPLARQPGATASGGAPSFYFLDAASTLPVRASEPVFPTASAPYFLDASMAGATGDQSPTPVPATPSTVDHLLSPFEFLELRAERIPDLALVSRPFDPRAIRRDFPILQERVHGRPLIWLDNAATTQKPNAVIERLSEFYQRENSNIHRAAHTLAARATDAYEAAREKVRRFLNAPSGNEIVFVRGTTEGINLVAQSWGRRHVERDDEIVITWLEHHANIVPWQQLCAEKGARLRVAPVDDHGQVILEEYEKLLGPRTRLVALSQVSNALGTVTPAREMVEIAHRYGARVLVDGAQAVSHMAVDVQALDCDWYVFSGHKVFGPTGIGAVFGKEELLDTTPPWQGGGNMIADVTFEKTIYQSAPARFEAGTGNIADAVGLGAALDYLDQIGMENVSRYEHELLVYATAALAEIPGLRLIGTAREKAGVLSFVLDGFRSEDVGQALDREGIAVRAGHHCAQPILRRFGLESTVRPSLALYNLREEIDALVAALGRIRVNHSRRAV
ncbi:MAG: family 2A encapsulin nanocompartment cargo protein cysteine desulfurase [Candidatus Contendobacter sp.]